MSILDAIPEGWEFDSAIYDDGGLGDMLFVVTIHDASLNPVQGASQISLEAALDDAVTQAKGMSW